MKLLPVAERELRVASRRRGTYWVRFFGAGLGIGAVAVILLSTVHLRPVEQSQILFVTLSVVAFAYCLLSGVLTTSDCVSEERREGTLGLLFLTNLRGYDVVVGKLVASSVRAVSVVVALLPVIALPVLMGGVSGQVVWRVALVLGNTLFLSLAIGVLVSVLTREARSSIGVALAVLIGWVAVLPLLRVLWIEYVLRSKFPGGAPELEKAFHWVLDVNPAVLFSSALASLLGGGLTGKGIWQGLIAQHVLAWGLLLASCLILPRSWQDKVERQGKTTGRWAGEPGRIAAVRQGRAELLDWHPFAWMVVRDVRPWVYTWLGLSVVGGVWLWGFLELKEEWLEGIVGLWTAFSAGLWLKLRVAALSCRHLHEHRRSGALELVLSTPLTPESIVRGYLMGIRHTILPPLAAVCAGAGLLLVGSMQQEQGWAERTEVPVTFAVGLVVLGLDLVTIAWSGMWRGLNSQRYVRAYTMTVGMVLVLPWAIFVITLILWGALIETLNLQGNLGPGYLSLVAWWALISVGVDAWQWLSARRNLRERFRDMAAEPYGTIRVSAVSELGAAGMAGLAGAPVVESPSGKPL